MRPDNPGKVGAADGTRRDFLRRGALLALPVVFSGAAGTRAPPPNPSATPATTPSPAAAAARTLVPPERARGDARVDVRDKGAHGDGKHDDTAAFNAAVEALPITGGTVHVPAGSYLIDALKSVRLRSRMHLELMPGARLVAMANGSRKYFVVYASEVEDVEVSGGEIVGERNRHDGGDGEWGHGIQIRGASRVTVRDLHVSDCWGDGIYIGGAGARQAVLSDDVVISKVASTGNRRQGLSICQSRNVRVHDCEFSNTVGTNPQYGIDIEPNRPHGAYNIHIENCLIRDNRGGGIQIFKRVAGVTVKDCTIERNHGAGIYAAAARDGVIVGNSILDNGLAGISLRKESHDFEVRGNRFDNNGIRRRAAGGHARGHARGDDNSEWAVRTDDDTRAIKVSDNRYAER